MWPFKSNTKTNQAPEAPKPTWQVEAERLEAEAERIERISNTALFRADLGTRIMMNSMQYFAKAAELRSKALALRIYRGEEPKKAEKKPGRKPVKKATRSRR